MAIENRLNARLQHAVEVNHGDTNQTPNDSSTPLKGEVIFNKDLDNFKVGDGEHSYGQLNNFLPSIPAAANNGTLTIQKNGTTVGTFSADQSINTTVNITVPATTETWTFILDDGTTVQRTVYILNN